MRSHKPPQIVRLTPLYRMTVVGEGTTYPRHRDPCQRFAPDRCHLRAERQQHRRDNQGGRERHLPGIGGARPPVRQSHPPFGQRTRLLAPPASPRQRTDWAGRPPLRLEDMGQRARPHALPPPRDQAHGRATRVRTVLAPLPALIPIRWATPQLLHRALGALLPPTGAKEAVRSGAGIQPQQAKKSQSAD